MFCCCPNFTCQFGFFDIFKEMREKNEELVEEKVTKEKEKWKEDLEEEKV